jgi:hypothetical protein
MVRLRESLAPVVEALGGPIMILDGGLELFHFDGETWRAPGLELDASTVEALDRAALEFANLSPEALDRIRARLAPGELPDQVDAGDLPGEGGDDAPR